MLIPHISAMTLPHHAIAQICSKLAQSKRGGLVTGIVDLEQKY